MTPTALTTGDVIAVSSDTPYVDWRSILAGGVAASALSVLLAGFGAALGLSMTSARPYAGFSALAIAIVTGVWFAAVNVGSFAAGGYLAGRLRRPANGPDHETQFRDGAHGFMVWALGTLLAAWLLAGAAGSVIGAAGSLAKGAADVAATAAGGAAQNMAARATATMDPIAYASDTLLRRTDATPATPAAAGDRPNEEVGRILATAVASGTLAPADRQYLARVIAPRAGIPPEEAEKRVDEAFAKMQAAKAETERKAREAAETARKGTVIAAFLAAAVSLAGLVAAAWAAGMGGEHRDRSLQPAGWTPARRLW